MATPALSRVAIALESPSAQGEPTLLAPTAVAATLSLTTQPPVNSKLHVTVYGNSASGTVAIAGKDIAGNVVTETIPPTGSIPTWVPGGQSGEVNNYEYVTVNNFSSVDASGITTTGLTNGIIKIESISAARFAHKGIMQHTPKIEQISPNEMVGVGDLHTDIIESTRAADISDFSQEFYADGGLWLPAMGISNSPTISTVPASPTSLKTATTITASPTTISTITAPTAPGMLLQFVANGSVTPAGTIAVAGTDQYGNAVSETIPIKAGAGTYSTANVYSSITSNSVTVTGPTAGTITINGYFLNSFDFKPGGQTYTAAVEVFTGTDSEILPFFYLDEGSVEWDSDAGKELKTSGKGSAADTLPIGDRTTAIQDTSRITSLTQPSEIALAGWQVNVFLDTTGANFFTTQFFDLLNGKITFKTGNTPKYTSNNSQNYNRVYRKKWECTFEGEIDFRNEAEMERFRKNNKRYWGVQFVGPYVGSNSGALYKQWKFYLAVKYETLEKSYNPDAENVSAKFSARCEYDPALGYSHRVLVLNQQQTSYLS